MSTVPTPQEGSVRAQEGRKNLTRGTGGPCQGPPDPDILLGKKKSREKNWKIFGLLLPKTIKSPSCKTAGCFFTNITRKARKDKNRRPKIMLDEI